MGAELTPREVLADLFAEELHPDPELMADTVIKRLQDAGFKIVGLPHCPSRSPR